MVTLPDGKSMDITKEQTNIHSCKGVGKYDIVYKAWEEKHNA